MNPVSPRGSCSGPPSPAAEPANGSTSPNASWPRPRAGTPPHATRWRPSVNWPGSSSGTRRPAAVPRGWRSAARNATAATNSCPARARRIWSPRRSACGRSPSGPTARLSRHVSGHAPGCLPNWPRRAPGNWPAWNEDSGRSWARSTPHAVRSGAAGRSTPNGPGWSGSPAPTTTRSTRRPNGWPAGTPLTGASGTASRGLRTPRPARNNWPAGSPRRAGGWRRRVGATPWPRRRKRRRRPSPRRVSARWRRTRSG